MTKKAWTEEEREYLRKNYPNQPRKASAEFLGRSINSVENEVNRMKVKSRKRLWTEEDLSFLNENYDKITYLELEKALSKSYLQIYKKLKDLGLKKVNPNYAKEKKQAVVHQNENDFKPWSSEEIDFVKNSIDKMTSKEMAKVLKRSYKSVCHTKLCIKNYEKTKIATKEELYQKYIVEEQSTVDMANFYNCSATIIRSSLIANNVVRDKQISGKRKNSKIWSGHGEISGSFFGNIRRRANKNNIFFDITIEYAWGLYLEQNRKCKISGVDIEFLNQDTRASLDRIDSSIGYVEGNVQWVHKQVNFMKQTMSDQELINWCKLIVENNK